MSLRKCKCRANSPHLEGSPEATEIMRVNATGHGTRRWEPDHPVTLRNTPGTMLCGLFPTVFTKSERLFSGKKGHEIVAQDGLYVVGSNEELIGIDAMGNQSAKDILATILVERQTGEVLKAQAVIVVDLGVF